MPNIQVVQNKNQHDDDLFGILNESESSVQTKTFAKEKKSIHQKELNQKYHTPLSINKTQKEEILPPSYQGKSVTSMQFNNETIADKMDDFVKDIESSIELPNPLNAPAVITDNNNKHINRERAIFIEKISPALKNLFADNSIKEIHIQSYQSVYITNDNEKEMVNDIFTSENALKDEMERFYEQAKEKYVNLPFYREFLLPGNIKIAVLYPPISENGIAATISFPNFDHVKPKDFIKQNILTKEMLYFLERCVRGHINILVSGNHRDIQIDFLNLLNSYIPEAESIFAVDSRYELLFSHNNVLKVNTSAFNAKEYDVFNIAEQLKPDRIAINELNAENIKGFLELSSMRGYTFTSSIYATSPRNMCNNRIPLFYKVHCNQNKELEFLPGLITDGLQIVVHLTKISNEEYKVTHICHADGLNNEGNVNLKEIFVFNKQKEAFERPGYIPKKIIKRIKDQDIPFDDTIFNT